MRLFFLRAKERYTSPAAYSQVVHNSAPHPTFYEGEGGGGGKGGNLRQSVAKLGSGKRKESLFLPLSLHLFPDLLLGGRERAPN